MKNQALGKKPKNIRLTKRDIEVFITLYQTRYMTTPQIQALFWPPAKGKPYSTLKPCQRRLRLYTEHRFLRRLELPWFRGEGRKPYVYALDQVGAQIVAHELGLDPKRIDWQRRGDPEYLFLQHVLATNDVRVAITLAARENGWKIEKWVEERTLRSQAMRDYVTIQGPRGGKQKVAVIPDGYFILHLGDRRGHHFLEIDRRTVTVEPTSEEQNSWRRKVRAYLAYYQSGKYSERYQTKSLRILTVTTGERRLSNLKRITEKSGGRSHFWFTTFDLATPENILTAPIWQVAGRQGEYILIE